MSKKPIVLYPLSWKDIVEICRSLRTNNVSVANNISTIKLRQRKERLANIAEEKEKGGGGEEKRGRESARNVKFEDVLNPSIAETRVSTYMLVQFVHCIRMHMDFVLVHFSVPALSFPNLTPRKCTSCFVALVIVAVRVLLVILPW